MKYRSQDRGRELQVQEDRLHRHQAHLQVRRLPVHQIHQEDLQVLLVRLLHHPILIMKVDQKIEVKNSKNFVAMLICEKMSISI